MFILKTNQEKKNIFLKDLSLNVRKITLSSNYLVETIYEKFDYTAFTISSCFFYNESKKINCLMRGIKFKNKYKYNFVRLLKKNTYRNFNKINFI